MVKMRQITSICFLVFGIFGLGSAQIVTENAPDLTNIDVIEHPGAQIPLELSFTDAQGKAIHLRDYFQSGKPVLLTLAYYECPMLCTFVLNGLSDGVSNISFNPGEEFQMITVSIDPDETPQLAAAKKKNQIGAIGRSIPENGWEFLVGDKQNIDSLAHAVGFKFYYDAERDEFAHPAVSFVLTEDGTISRYLYGINYPSKDFRFALMEASEGKIGDTFDKLLLYCYHYDPDSKGYVLFAGNVMRIGGVITMIIIGIILTAFWKKEIRKKSEA